MPSNYCIFANNAQISISCESSVNTEFVCSKPINIESPIVCLGASQSGTIMVLGTGRAKYTHEILVNGEFMIFAQTVNYGKILNGTGSGGKPPVFKVVEDAIGKRYQCDSGGAISTGNRGPS